MLGEHDIMQNLYMHANMHTLVLRSKSGRQTPMVEINEKATSFQVLSTSLFYKCFSASEFPVSQTAMLCIDFRTYNKF